MDELFIEIRKWFPGEAEEIIARIMCGETPDAAIQNVIGE